jgi:hypothetical protein
MVGNVTRRAQTFRYAAGFPSGCWYKTGTGGSACNEPRALDGALGVRYFLLLASRSAGPAS